MPDTRPGSVRHPDWWTPIVNKYPLGKTRGSDALSYALTNSAGITTDHKDQMCFGGHRSHFADRSWAVRPCETSANPLPFPQFAEWVDLCKVHNIMPANAEVSLGGDNKINIRLSGNYHQVFAGLNCYRWGANYKELPAITMELLKARPQIHFFQAFHFALKRYNIWSNHSFSDGITPPTAYGDSKVHLIASVLMPHFFRDPENPNSPCRTASTNYLTNWGIVEYGKSLGFPKMTSIVASQGLFLKSPNHVLWDEWAELYGMEPSKKAFEAYYEQVLKDRGIELAKVQND